MKISASRAWILLFLVGLGIASFAYDNLVVIQALDPADPARGWAWLTTDPDVIAYIKFWFRNFGIWVFAVSVFVLVVSATGFRRGEKWAWYSLLYLPVHIGIHMAIWPWLIPALSFILILTLAGLLLPFRSFFPSDQV